MNNEPVAWQVAEMIFDIEESAMEMAKVYGDEIIPLYTHPVKELTDEEIEKIKQALTIAMGCTLELSPCAEEFCKQEQLPWLEATERLAKEALAILRKAQEKC